MFIKTVHLENFKRFTDLTLDLSRLDPPPKLVLLIGANGSGKTSIFDAFSLLSKTSAKDGHSLGSGDNFNEYYRKFGTENFATRVEFIKDDFVEQVNGKFATTVNATNIFYGRSALRQVPKLQRKGGGNAVDVSTDSDRPQRFIDRDQRFENDIDAIATNIWDELFGSNDFDSRELRERFLGPVNESLIRIFGSDAATSLSLEKLTPPRLNEVADLRFRKGNSVIHYDLLSSGEKEIFNILLNLFSRREYYQDTIYFIDELDVHLNTSLQYTLLKEIVENWIPDGCQLWTASHSLGFIQYAQEAEHAAILDFDQYDFDQQRTITPELKDSATIYEIAVPEAALSVLFKDRDIIFCENQDVRFYHELKLAGKIFAPAKDKNDVYFRAKNNPKYYGLMDRDYLSSDEIIRIREKYRNLFVLDFYSIESYLYHPQNIKEAEPKFDVDGYMTDILRQKIERRDNIVAGIQSARGSYQMLLKKNETDIVADDAINQIIDATKTDDFDTYYPYLDMKSIINLDFLQTYNLPKTRLAQTKWFGEQIRTLLDR